MEDAKAALGDAALDDPMRSLPLADGGSTCTWSTSDEDNYADVVVQIGSFDLLHSVLNNHKTQAVSGIGDEALLYGAGSDTYFLFVRTGSTAIQTKISAPGGKLGDPEALPPRPIADTLETLAKTVLSHL
ncbi:MAG: hypothetical protein HOV66_19875 [Streptomycetaceae bacterium]|nr:hypothetical protein [Streptomycetaceae bacterium]